MGLEIWCQYAGLCVIFSPADLSLDSRSLGSDDVQIAAGMAGGRRRMRGGSPLSPASVTSTDITGQGIDGQGITNYGSMGSVGVQMAAGMAGGKRRRRRMRMMGGTTSVTNMGLTESGPLADALSA